MVFTVNSSAGAFAALQNLQKSGRGLKPSALTAQEENKDKKDDGAVVDKGAAKDATGLGAVKESLSRAQSATQVAFAAADKVGGLLGELQEKARQAQSDDLADADREALNEAFKAQRDEITTVVEDADYHGFNAVKAGGQPILAVATEKGDRVIEVSAQDLSLGGPNVVLRKDQDIASADAAKAADEAITTSITRVDQATGSFEQGTTRIDAQIQFVDRLATTIDQGIGNLVDVGLERESASLQALHVKQQLGVQDLSIANQSPGAILSLFR